MNDYNIEELLESKEFLEKVEGFKKVISDFAEKHGFKTEEIELDCSQKSSETTPTELNIALSWQIEPILEEESWQRE